MRFLITGISGFAGTHLAAALLEAGHWVSGLARQVQTRRLEEIQRRHPKRFPPGAVRACDLRDGPLLRETLRRAKPDGIFHLAGMAFVPRSYQDPRAAYEVNLLGSVELLAAARESTPSARVVFVSTGEVYGRIHELPIRETHPLEPISPYGVAKAAADLAAFQHHWSAGMDVVRARPFNHTGPGQSSDFVCSEFARAIAAAETGIEPAKLRVGNLDVERDFSDVRDVVRGYVALFEKGRAGEAYNVGAGASVRIRSILDRLLAASTVRFDVEVDPAKVRPNETPRIVAAIDKIRAETGWEPRIPLDRTLEDLLADWRAELRGER